MDVRPSEGKHRLTGTKEYNDLPARIEAEGSGHHGNGQSLHRGFSLEVWLGEQRGRRAGTKKRCIGRDCEFIGLKRGLKK